MAPTLGLDRLSEAMSHGKVLEIEPLELRGPQQPWHRPAEARPFDNAIA